MVGVYTEQPAFIRQLLRCLCACAAVCLLAACETTEEVHEGHVEGVRPQDVVHLTLHQIEDEVEANELRFADTYDGKVLQVKGVITRFHEFIDHHVYLSHDAEDWNDIVDCLIIEDDLQRIFAYDVGDPVEVRGLFDDVAAIDDGIRLKGCELVR